ncbi:MAG: hypothetical protein ACLFMY_00745 [Guyparkeria sp.]|uniref:hypothetical protein n=1 Tax=Guyparkeria sp. TaxID=2035736 RepID=UPI003978F1B8
MKAIHFGIRNRQSPALVSAFFDPDMPAEWRVGFLLNEHDALWVGPQADDVETVLAELADAPAPVVVVVDDSRWSGAWDELAARDFHLVLRRSESTPIWRPGTGDAGRAARVGLIPASDDPAQLREWLEAFMGQCPGPGALFVDGEPPSTATVDRLKTMAELMGL